MAIEQCAFTTANPVYTTADIGPIMALGVPGMGLSVAGERYFWYHHSPADTIDKLDPDDVNLGVATMGVMALTVANLEERLPR